MKAGRDGAVTRILRLLAEHIEAYLDGDDLALETLAEAVEQESISPEDLHTVAILLRNLVSEPIPTALHPMDGEPGARTHRVLNAQERDSMSPEAWGYLIDLRRRGSLDSGQFEQVLDLLTGSGVRPIGVELAREVATRVALQVDDAEGGTDLEHGEIDLAH